MNTTSTTDSSTPPRTPSRHYFYRKASLPPTNTSYTPTTPPILLNDTESAHVFENKLESFIKKPSIQQTVTQITSSASADLARRKADRKARKEKEGEKVLAETPNTTQTTPFEKLALLLPQEKSAWLNNIHDDAMLLNPHQWLKLANLFNVNSKTARQQTLLSHLPYLPNVLEDRSISKEQVRPLENYLELRDIQNRNYARDS